MPSPVFHFEHLSLRRLQHLLPPYPFSSPFFSPSSSLSVHSSSFYYTPSFLLLVSDTVGPNTSFCWRFSFRLPHSSLSVHHAVPPPLPSFLFLPIFSLRILTSLTSLSRLHVRSPMPLPSSPTPTLSPFPSLPRLFSLATARLLRPSLPSPFSLPISSPSFSPSARFLPYFPVHPSLPSLVLRRETSASDRLTFVEGLRSGVRASPRNKAKRESRST